MADLLESQIAIDNAVYSLQNWKGFDEPVDIFEYTDGAIYKAIRKSSKSFNPLIRFDPQHFPPTEQGLSKLIAEIQVAALKQGSYLIQRNHPNTLCCFQCRRFRSHKKINKDNNDDNATNYTADDSRTNANESIEDQEEQTNSLPIPDFDLFDEDGVKLGIRHHTIHRNRSNNRAEGRLLQRNTSTRLPTTMDKLCTVSVCFDILEDQYIFLQQGCGHNIHSFHPKPLHGELALRSRHLSEETKKLIQDGGKASVPTSSIDTIPSTLELLGSQSDET